MQKNPLQNPKERNLANSIELDLFFRRGFVKNEAIPEFICEVAFGRFTEIVYQIMRYKIQKKKKKSSKLVLESYPFTLYIFIKKIQLFKNLESFLRKISIS